MNIREGTDLGAGHVELRVPMEFLRNDICLVISYVDCI